jgi:hypothetical protein
MRHHFLRAIARSLGIEIEGFTSLTFGGPYTQPASGFSIGDAGDDPFGVAIGPNGADEPTHDASGSIM